MSCLQTPSPYFPDQVQSSFNLVHQFPPSSDSSTFSSFLLSSDIKDILQNTSATLLCLIISCILFSLITCCACFTCICCRLNALWCKRCCCNCLSCEPQESKPYTTCQRNCPIFWCSCGHLFSLFSSLVFLLYSYNLQQNISTSSCQFSALRVASKEMYEATSLSSFPILQFDSNITSISNFRRNVNVLHSKTALQQLHATITNLKSDIDITQAPTFRDSNSRDLKFYLYDTDGNNFNSIYKNCQQSLNVLQSALDTRIAPFINSIDTYVLEKETRMNTQRVIAAIGADKTATLSFVNKQLLNVDDIFSFYTSGLVLNYLYWVGVLVGIPILTCMCSFTGMCGLHRGDFEHSELLDGWDSHSGKFTHTRQVMHLVGTTSKTGARCNGCTWCCALSFASLNFLLGGILLVTNGLGNNMCSFLPTLVSDLPAYIPTTSAEDSDRDSNLALTSGLLSTCLESDETISMTLKVNKGLNISFIGFMNVKTVDTFNSTTVDLLDNLSLITSKLQATNELSPSYFWSSQLNKYEKSIPSFQRYVDMNQTAMGATTGIRGTKENEYRIQDQYIFDTLSKIQSSLNWTHVKKKMDHLNRTFEAVHSIERLLTPLKKSINSTEISESCLTIEKSLSQFVTTTCGGTVPLFFLMGFSLLISALAGILVSCSTLLLQRRFGGHGAIPVSYSRPSEQHHRRPSHFEHVGSGTRLKDSIAIEMKKNPMSNPVNTRKESVVHDLNGPMQQTDWM